MTVRSFFSSFSGASRRAAALPATLGKAATLVACLWLASCAVLEQQGSKPISAEIPAAAPRTLGVETLSSAEHKKMIANFGGEYHDPAAEHFLNDILVKLAKSGGEPTDPYTVTILNSPVVNAFAMPPDKIYITRGLLTLANDASEVAAVMAHEIAHITAHHAMLRAEREKRAAIITQASSVIQSRERSAEVAEIERRTIASFSRQQEFDADEIGIKTMADAGYDPYAASRFLNTMEQARQLHATEFGQAAAAQPDLLATHPSTPARVAHAIEIAKQYGPPGTGTADRTAYLAAIDGMMYGDDPTDGAIRGRTFIHPRLGFIFVAPDGFVLENSAQAVLGVKGGGAEALRLDSVRLAETTSLESYINSGWIDGLLRSSVQSITVNGMPAITATARAGEWNFRVVLIRFDSTQVYRLIFAVHNLTDEIEKSFRTAIDSFRHTTDDEAARVKPFHIVIVTARQGDKAETLATQMGTLNRPLENFELLNDLHGTGPLKVGEHYKIVTE
ncbi:MAG TPA: M48 family metalloprotease [Methylovirgula sp.]|jgi:predicted Zn-dependent protease|nr:M48 family metalloprotease [Methylovirgula sp.]